MKRFFKVIMWIIVGFIGIGVLGSVLGEDNTATETTKTENSVEVEETSNDDNIMPVANEEESKEPENESTISKAEFDQIQNGMSYDEVVNIIGSEGELLSESGSEGEQFHTVMYMWQGEGDIGANANFMFQSGNLENKSQFGLK